MRPVRFHIFTMVISFGLVAGFLIFLLTAILLIKGGEVIGPHLSLLGQYLPGYTVSWGGSVIGFMWGVIIGGLFGGVFGSIYNKLVEIREK